MSPSFARSEITADSIRQERNRQAELERQASLQNLSLHRVPELPAHERDTVLQGQAQKKQELAREVIGTIRPEEITAQVKEETRERTNSKLKGTDAVPAAATREEIGATARQLTREVGREHGLASHETERMATEVAELAASAAAGKAAVDELLSFTGTIDHTIAGMVTNGADGVSTRNSSEHTSREPDRRGGKGFSLAEYSPRGRVVRIAA